MFVCQCINSAACGIWLEVVLKPYITSKNKAPIRLKSGAYT
jgi:hypothetical protein